MKIVEKCQGKVLQISNISTTRSKYCIIFKSLVLGPMKYMKYLTIGFYSCI